MRIIIFLNACLLTFAQVADVKCTAMQCLITYVAPSNSACTISVKEEGKASVVNDVNATLFTNADQDSTHLPSLVTLAAGNRQIILGQKRADVSLDGWTRKSRALQTATHHTGTVVCGGTTFNLDFTTTNYPFGNTHNEQFPANAANPNGPPAWPDFDWNSTDRAQAVVDPTTGFLIKPLFGVADVTYTDLNIAFSATATGTNWTSPDSARVDDSSAATYSAATSDPLFLPWSIAKYPDGEGLHGATVNVFNWIDVFVNAWASTTGESIDVCIGTSSGCLTDSVNATLVSCTTSCTVGNRFNVIPSPLNGMASWWSGHAGIPQLDTVALTAAGTGILIKKHSSTAATISVQYANIYANSKGGNLLSSDGDDDSGGNCSTVTTYFGATPGKMCYYNDSFIWKGVDLTVNRLGFAGSTQGGSTYPCFVSHPSGTGFWDATDGNTFWSVVLEGCSTASPYDYMMVKFVYSGDHSDKGPITFFGTLDNAVWTATNATYTAGSPTTLNAQMLAYDQAAPNPRMGGLTNWGYPKNLQLVGRMRGKNQFVIVSRVGNGINDSMCTTFLWDATSQNMVFEADSWSTWPYRWSACHGWGYINDPTYVVIPSAFYHAGNTSSGQGPYYFSVAAALSATPSTCPAWPGSGPISSSDWPVGNYCTSIVIDGEPGNPNQSKITGHVNITGTALTAVEVNPWDRFVNGKQFRIGVSSTIYTVTYIDQKHLTISSAPGDGANQTYTLYMETIQTGLTGNGEAGFLQYLQPRDIFCASQSYAASGTGGSGSQCSISVYTTGTGTFGEYIRVLSRTGSGPGSTLVVERGWSGNGHSHTAFAALSSNWIGLMFPSSCAFPDWTVTTAPAYPCQNLSSILWNSADVYGQNTGDAYVPFDANAWKFGGHGTEKNGVSARIDISFCSNLPILCHGVRLGAVPARYSVASFGVAYAAPFHGLLGHASAGNDANEVDTHATAYRPGTQVITDGRPTLGATYAMTTGTLVTGQLYKFTSANLNLYRPRHMPVQLSCRAGHVAYDISGLGLTLGSSSTDSGKTCTALNANECVSGSAVGDVYINCPNAPTANCQPWQNGAAKPDANNICIFDQGMQDNYIVQTSVAHADVRGAMFRRISGGLGQPSRQTGYWNSGGDAANGNDIIFAGGWHGNIGPIYWIAKTPQLPGDDGVNRGEYQPVKISVPPGLDNAVALFGYTNEGHFYCTPNARKENCYSASATLADFKYSSELGSGVSCSGGCTLTIPAITQNILCYQVLQRNVSNTVIQTWPTTCKVIQ